MIRVVQSRRTIRRSASTVSTAACPAWMPASRRTAISGASLVLTATIAGRAGTGPAAKKRYPARRASSSARVSTGPVQSSVTVVRSAAGTMRGSGVSASGFSAERARASATNARSARRAASVRSVSARSGPICLTATAASGANEAQAESAASNGITVRAMTLLIVRRLRRPRSPDGGSPCRRAPTKCGGSYRRPATDRPPPETHREIPRACPGLDPACSGLDPTA